MSPKRASIPLGPLAMVLLASTTVRAQCEVLDLAGTYSDGAAYGWDVDLAGDRLAVGQYLGAFDWATGGSPGMVHLFRREASGWIADGTVQASDGEAGSYFGWSVALDADRLLVGSPTDGWFGAKGAVYVFERQGDGLWLQTAKLVPEEPQALAAGWSVALEGDVAVIGAKGAATLGLGWGRVFVYRFVGGSWELEQELLPSFSKAGDAFGCSLALQGERLVVGASYMWQVGAPNTGHAFVFERGPEGWHETAVLTASDAHNADVFGTGVALDGDTIIVGAANHPAPGGSGAAFVFEHTGTTWVQSAKITSADLPATGYGFFGWAVDLEQDRALIGACQEHLDAPFSGAGYLFERSGPTWSQVSKLTGSALDVGDSFGYAVDLEGSEVVVGAPSASTSGSAPGEVYLFSLEPGPYLVADGASVSISQGGAQGFQLGACAPHAGDLYFIAGSATGTSPGLALAGQPVPLNADAYFLHTVNHPGSAPLAGAVGLLDAYGRADAVFALPPGSSPALAGLVLHHAYAVLDAATLQLMAVSPAVPVELVP